MRAAIGSLVGTVAVIAVGCTFTTSSPPQVISPKTTTSPSSVSVSSVPPSTTASPTPASDDNACVSAQFTAQQFVGDWTEQDGTLVRTLGADGTLSSRDGGTAESGTWSFLPWQSSPAKNEMPDSAANQCVLWLRINSPTPVPDLVYVPLTLTKTTLELSYVGRGNTITWVRRAGSQ